LTIDSSAIVAILMREPLAARLWQAIERSERRLISTFSVLEVTLVLSGRRKVDPRGGIASFLDDLRIVKIPFDERQLAAAQDAFLRYGRGNHRAKLNFGDCATYALADTTGEALLCTGDDFAGTDLALVPYQGPTGRRYRESR